MVLLLTVFSPSHSLVYFTDLLALKKRRKGSGNCILSFIASWILRMFPKMVWNLPSCLSRLANSGRIIWFPGWQKHTRGYRKLVYLSLQMGILVVAEEFGVLHFCLESTKQIDCEIF